MSTETLSKQGMHTHSKPQGPTVIRATGRKHPTVFVRKRAGRSYDLVGEKITEVKTTLQVLALGSTVNSKPQVSIFP